MGTRAIPRCPDGRTYGHGCRCSFCVRQMNISQELYRHRQAQCSRGIMFDMDMIDVAETRQLILDAIEQRQLTQREVSRLCGITHDVVRKIIHKQKRVTRATARKVANGLGDPDQTSNAPEARVDNTWVRAMILALCAQGWSKDHQRDIIQNNLGVSGGFIYSALQRDNTNTYGRNVASMKWLVGAIGHKTGPSRIAMAQMRARGVFPVRHYNLKGELIVSTLNAEQRAQLKRVRS